MDIFRGKEGFMAFGGFLNLLEAFCMVLWVFDGNMVGKWTNEPCNGVDEVVNPFWVLTEAPESMRKACDFQNPTFSTCHLSS